MICDLHILLIYHWIFLDKRNYGIPTKFILEKNISKTVFQKVNHFSSYLFVETARVVWSNIFNFNLKTLFLLWILFWNFTLGRAKNLHHKELYLGYIQIWTFSENVHRVFFTKQKLHIYLTKLSSNMETWWIPLRISFRLLKFEFILVLCAPEADLGLLPHPRWSNPRSAYMFFLFVSRT